MMADSLSFSLCLIQQSIGIGRLYCLLAIYTIENSNTNYMSQKWKLNAFDETHRMMKSRRICEQLPINDTLKLIQNLSKGTGGRIYRVLFFFCGRNCWMARLDGEMETIVNLYCHIICYIIISQEWNRKISIKMPDMVWQATKYPHTHPISWYEWKQYIFCGVWTHTYILSYLRRFWRIV